jgi:hypothetical protein
MRVVFQILEHTQGVRGTYVGQAFSWVTLVLAWLMAFAIGIAIYFPIARLLDSLIEQTPLDGACRGKSFPPAKEFLLRCNSAPSFAA